MNFMLKVAVLMSVPYLIASSCDMTSISNDALNCAHNGHDIQDGQTYKDPETCMECTCDLGARVMQCCGYGTKSATMDIPPNCRMEMIDKCDYTVRCVL